MDTRATIEAQMREIDEVPQETVKALSGAVTLLAGWYRNLKLGPDEVKAWAFLMRDLDATLFIPAAMAWGTKQSDWPPTAPQFRQMVRDLESEQRRGELRLANARLLEASKASDSTPTLTLVRDTGP